MWINTGMKFYTVYKTTYSGDGRYYIGVHKTSNPNDLYRGSGKHLRAAMKQYGYQNFKKEVLFVFDNAKDAYQKEAELVTPALIESGTVFNLVAGGSPSPDWVLTRKVERKGKPQPNISKAKRKNSPMVGNFLVSFPPGVIEDSPETIIFQPVDDLLAWAEVHSFSESTVRHLLSTGKPATQGALRGVFITRIS